MITIYKIAYFVNKIKGFPDGFTQSGLMRKKYKSGVLTLIILRIGNMTANGEYSGVATYGVSLVFIGFFR